ncbi:uncharacterized protein LOC116220492 isoform X2 [Clupea harengus]|nr:uncharacterized protein LOC116220492 isoform X2 [Clupea harengus]
MSDSGTETTHLPRLWSEGLPPEDHKWIVETLFKLGPKGKLELQDNLQLWYNPPQPSYLYHQAPAPDHFFAHSLLVWMPYKLWKVKVVCPNPPCGRHQLTGGGLHKRARRVLDLDRIYNMVTETLICTKCRSTHVSWSQTVLTQLDLAHRSKFQVILTKRFACDIRVIRLLRQRGQGNGPTQVFKHLSESHTEEWLHRVAMYTTECVDFLQRPELLPVAFPKPPEPAVVPSCKWLLSFYRQDILTRLEDIQARITSTHGTILKMDSTKKITRKLAGTAEGTALCLTSVGNEYGQILISVLTAPEGAGLDLMAAGLVMRYQQAAVDPPVALYVDSGCCIETGETKLKPKFSGWPDLIIRLDVWHYMCRLALGCTTAAHQVYPIFMSRLSACIFEWDAADLALLCEAKTQQLQCQGLSSLDITKRLSREELALHCRRRTRGELTTTRMLEELLQMLMGTSGNDSHGVPLFDRERMEHIWSVQRKHVKCIQDPPGVALYTKMGERTKGGVRVPMYRCARGSTSLESFYLHLNRFIPGTSANNLNFQIYLLEGLHRWNQDRGGAALATGPSALSGYSGDLLHRVNTNYEKLFGRKVAPEFCPPSRYTGELIGIQYLFRQTGQALQDMHPDSEEAAQFIEEHDVEDSLEEDECFSDVTDDPTVLDPEVLQAPASQVLGPSTVTSGLTSLSSTLAIPTSTVAPGTSSMGLGTFPIAPSRSTLVPGPSAVTASTSEMAPGTSTLTPGTFTPVPGTSAMASSVATPPYSSSSDAGVDSAAEDEDMAVDDQTVQWHDNGEKKPELSVLPLGTVLPPVLIKTEEPLQEAEVLPAEPMPAQPEYQCRLPVSTAGQVQQRQTASSLLVSTAGQVQQRQMASSLLLCPIMPNGPGKRELFATPPAPGPFLTTQIFVSAGQPVSLLQVVLPRPAVQGTRPQTCATIPKRPYKRTVQSNTCKKCGHFRTTQTGHSGFRGKVYCPLLESLPKGKWLAWQKIKFQKK